MIKKFLSISSLVIACLVFLSPNALANHCGCEEASHKMHEVVATLDLTQKQKDKIKGIFDRARDAATAKYNEMYDVHMLVNAAYADGTMTEDKLNEFINKQQQIVSGLVKIRMTERFDLSKVITPEQKQKLDKIINDWMKDHKDNSKAMH